MGGAATDEVPANPRSTNCCAAQFSRTRSIKWRRGPRFCGALALSGVAAVNGKDTIHKTPQTTESGALRSSPNKTISLICTLGFCARARADGDYI
jgi:hypothetical protein